MYIFLMLFYLLEAGTGAAYFEGGVTFFLIYWIIFFSFRQMEDFSSLTTATTEMMLLQLRAWWDCVSWTQIHRNFFIFLFHNLRRIFVVRWICFRVYKQAKQYMYFYYVYVYYNYLTLIQLLKKFKSFQL